LRKQITEGALTCRYATHSHILAFEGIDFRSNQNGILRSTVADILHTVEEGLLVRRLSLDVLFLPMCDGTTEKVDSLVEEIFCSGSNRSGGRERFPHVSFARGYSSLTLPQANK
jgi:hypothetical protein